MFYLFGGADYYPQGGMKDYIDKFETIEQAMAAAKMPIPPDNKAPEWAEIVAVIDQDLRTIAKCTWRENNGQWIVLG